MRGVLRWLAIIGSSLIGLVVLAIAMVAIISQSIIGARHEVRAESLAKPSAELLADAERQARTHGCLGCHGEGLRGELMEDVPNVIRLHAPNLTQVAAKASDQQLAAAIRQGIGMDGRALFVMPSEAYSRMSDADLAALIAWMRTLPRAAGNEEGVTLGPIGRMALAMGKIRPSMAKLDEYRSQMPIDLGPDHALGRKITMETCAGCHGPALFGQTMEDGNQPPDLATAAGYDREQFRTLMRTGVPPDGRDLGLMKFYAQHESRYLNDGELDALYAYLTARAKRLSR